MKSFWIDDFWLKRGVKSSYKDFLFHKKISRLTKKISSNNRHHIMPMKKSKAAPKKKRVFKVEDQNINTVEHYNAVLIEDLHSKMDFVIEHMNGVETRLSEKMDNIQQENNKRFDNIEGVLQYHSTLLNQNEVRWNQNDERWEQAEQRFDRIDERFDRLETKLDKVAEKVEQHDKDIQGIKVVGFSH